MYDRIRSPSPHPVSNGFALGQLRPWWWRKSVYRRLPGIFKLIFLLKPALYQKCLTPFRKSLQNLYFKLLTSIFIQITSHNKSFNAQEFVRGNKEERMQIGKASFARWNLSEAVEQADRRLANQKLLFREKRINFQPSTNYEEYCKKIKENIAAFAKLFKLA